MNTRNNKLSHAPILQVLSWSPETDIGMAGCLVGPEAAPHCRADPPRWCLEAQSGPSPICQRTEGTAYVSNQQLSAASVFTKRRLCELIPMRLEKFFKSLLQIWILVNSLQLSQSSRHAGLASQMLHPIYAAQISSFLNVGNV